MKNRTFIKWCTVVGCLVAIMLPKTVLAVDLQELIRRVEQQYNGDSSHVLATMHIVTSEWSRSISMDSSNRPN